MTATTATPILSVDEAIERHPNEWIFMQVATEDEYHTPSHGIILSHHPSRSRLQRSILTQIAARTDPSVRYYLFQAFPRNLTLKQCIENSEALPFDRFERAILREGLD